MMLGAQFFYACHTQSHCNRCISAQNVKNALKFTPITVSLPGVSELYLIVLFADDTNMFIAGKDMDVLYHQLNEDVRNIQEWLRCNELSLNVLKTHYMVLTSINKSIDAYLSKNP